MTLLTLLALSIILITTPQCASIKTSLLTPIYTSFLTFGKKVPKVPKVSLQKNMYDDCLLFQDECLCFSVNRILLTFYFFETYSRPLTLHTPYCHVHDGREMLA